MSLNEAGSDNLILLVSEHLPAAMSFIASPFSPFWFVHVFYSSISVCVIAEDRAFAAQALGTGAPYADDT